MDGGEESKIANYLLVVTAHFLRDAARQSTCFCCFSAASFFRGSIRVFVELAKLTANFFRFTFLRSSKNGELFEANLFCCATSTLRDQRRCDVVHEKDESTSKLDKPAKEVTDEEWRKMLPDEVYHVAREAGTERPHTSKFVKHFTPGKYNCYCCGAELFVSDAKFWTSCGWPSFSKSVEGDKNIVRIRDTSFGMERIEVRCKQCNAHLGHVFQNEGVTATEERYCINGCTLDFVPEKKD